jgi:hypothetical protein
MFDAEDMMAACDSRHDFNRYRHQLQWYQWTLFKGHIQGVQNMYSAYFVG